MELLLHVFFDDESHEFIQHGYVFFDKFHAVFHAFEHPLDRTADDGMGKEFGKEDQRFFLEGPVFRQGQQFFHTTLVAQFVDAFSP